MCDCLAIKNFRRHSFSCKFGQIPVGNGKVKGVFKGLSWEPPRFKPSLDSKMAKSQYILERKNNAYLFGLVFYVKIEICR